MFGLSVSSCSSCGRDKGKKGEKYEYYRTVYADAAIQRSGGEWVMHDSFDNISVEIYRNVETGEYFATDSYYNIYYNEYDRFGGRDVSMYLFMSYSNSDMIYFFSF